MKVIRKKYTGKKILEFEEKQRASVIPEGTPREHMRAAVVAGLWIGRNTDTEFRAMPPSEFDDFVDSIIDETIDNYGLMNFYQTLLNFYEDGVYQFMTEDDLEREIRIKEEEGRGVKLTKEELEMSWEDFVEHINKEYSEEQKANLLEKMKMRGMKILR